ncbi:hypothetical protein BDW71DRAFT_211922 [Aspergillus fruticulosus]
MTPINLPNGVQSAPAFAVLVPQEEIIEPTIGLLCTWPAVLDGPFKEPHPLLSFAQPRPGSPSHDPVIEAQPKTRSMAHTMIWPPAIAPSGKRAAVLEGRRIVASTLLCARQRPSHVKDVGGQDSQVADFAVDAGGLGRVEALTEIHQFFGLNIVLDLFEGGNGFDSGRDELGGVDMSS